MRSSDSVNGVRVGSFVGSKLISCPREPRDHDVLAEEAARLRGEP
jgi:hypothetical protein